MIWTLNHPTTCKTAMINSSTKTWHGHFFLPFFMASLFYHHQVSMPIARRLTPWHPRPTTQNLILNTSVAFGDSDFLSLIFNPQKWRKYIYIIIYYIGKWWEKIWFRKQLGSEWWETSRCWVQGQKPCTEHTSGILGSWNRNLRVSGVPVRPRSCGSEQLKIRTCLRKFR